MRRVILAFLALSVLALPCLAREGDHSVDTAGNSPSERNKDDMPGMDMSGLTSPLPSPHSGSGTAWQPASVPAYQWMTSRAQWDLMAHGAVFLTYNQQGGPRGAGKAESVNWLMLMEEHGWAEEPSSSARCFPPNR